MIRPPGARGAVVAVLAVAAVIIADGMAALAFAPGPPVRAASTRVSFAGTTFDGVEAENVRLAGTFHVITQQSAVDRSAVEWHVNVDQASGIGESTGRRYALHGAAKGTLPPGSPTRSATVEAVFSSYPLGPRTHPPSPIRFMFHLSFDEGGQITHVDAHLVGPSPPVID